MTADAPRSPGRRKADALAMLSARHADLWMATASPRGVAHLVPLSFAWDGVDVIVATGRRAVTTDNVTASGRARLALGTTRDVVMIDADLVATIAVPDAPAEIAERYAGAGRLGREASERRLRLPRGAARSHPGVARGERDRGAHGHARRGVARLTR